MGRVDHAARNLCSTGMLVMQSVPQSNLLSGRHDDPSRLHHRVLDHLRFCRWYRRSLWCSLGVRILCLSIDLLSIILTSIAMTTSPSWPADRPLVSLVRPSPEYVQLASLRAHYHNSRDCRSSSLVTNTTTLASTPLTTHSTTAPGLSSVRRVLSLPCSLSVSSRCH